MCYCLINPAGFFLLFTLLNLLPNKINCKRTLDTAFINCYPLTDNYVWKKVDLSFAECKYFSVINLNKWSQLELLDLNSICNIVVILLMVVLFYNPSFVSCYYYLSKLSFKSELRMQNIANICVKKRIKSIWIYKIINKINHFFQNNPEW